MKFEFRDDGGVDSRGNPAPAYGFVHRDSGTFVVDPYASPCGRFRVDPTESYGLGAHDASRLVRVNRGLGVAMPQSAD